MHRARSNTGDDLDKVKDALQKLKSENRKLRKENSQLRKELSKIEHLSLDREVESEEEIEFVSINEIEKKPICPKCRADTVIKINAGIYIVSLCSVCGYRKRQEVKPKPT